MLSLITFLPLLGAVAVVLAPKAWAKTLALATSLAVFATSVVMFTRYDGAEAGFQFVESMSWIAQYNIGYKLGVDGISIWLVMLTTLVFPIAIWFSADSVSKREKEYYALMLAMQTATLGVFMALDMFLFYVFWEFALVPMYLLIGIWVGERRVYA